MGNILSKLNMMGADYNWLNEWAVAVSIGNKRALLNADLDKLTEFRYYYIVRSDTLITCVIAELEDSDGHTVCKMDVFYKNSMESLLDKGHLYSKVKMYPCTTNDGQNIYPNIRIYRDHTNKTYIIFDEFGNGLKLRIRIPSNKFMDEESIYGYTLEKDVIGMAISSANGKNKKLITATSGIKVIGKPSNYCEILH